MKVKYIAIVLMCMLAVGGMAQTQDNRQRHNVTNTDSVPGLVSKYVDSLRLYKHEMDSIIRLRDSLGMESRPEGKYYRLFSPLTFYYNIASRQFDLYEDTIPTVMDMSLLSVYMRRPDLVLATQGQLEQAGTILKPSSDNVSPNAGIGEKVNTNIVEDSYVPIDVIIKKPNFWKYHGDFSLHANQYYQSDNWFQGGESNYNFHTTLTLKAIYNNKKDFTWENILEMRLGAINSRSDTLHKLRTNGDNMLRYTGKIGLRAIKKWNYTFQVIVTTQLFRQFNSNDEKVYSDIFSPLRVNPSLGMDYGVGWFKNRVTGSINIAPLAYSMTYCHRGNIADRFGIKKGKHFIDDYGSQITVNLTWNIAKDLSWKTRIYGYTSYHRSLIECENTFRFRLNKYLSSELFIYPRFDDSRARDEDHGYWHYKENFSFGFTYSL